MRYSHAVTGLLLGVSLTLSAEAQSSVDREILGVALTPNGGGAFGDSFFDIWVEWTIAADPISAPTNAGTVILVFKNGTEVPIMSKLIEVQLDGGSGICGIGGCSGGCGGGYIDGAFNTMLCLEDPPGCPAGNCDCGCKFPSIQSPMGEVPLEPGDEISVILVAAPGAAPDASGANQEWATTFDGVPHFWQRTIDWIELVPSSAGGIDVFVGGSTAWHGLQQTSELGFKLLLTDAKGNTIATTLVPGVAKPAGDPTACGGVGCGGLCGVWNGLQVDCSSFPNIYFLPCVCGGGWLVNFPGVDPDAIPGATVTLIPQPGGLPTLPGFPDEEGHPVVEPCLGELTGDGIVNAADLSVVLGAWGTPGPGDLNGDGTVDAVDLAIILAEWGPCIDV